MHITRGYDSSGMSKRTETIEVRKVGISWFVIPFPASRVTDLNMKNGSHFQHVIYSCRSPSSGAPCTFSPAEYLRVTHA